MLKLVVGRGGRRMKTRRRRRRRRRSLRLRLTRRTRILARSWRQKPAEVLREQRVPCMTIRRTRAEKEVTVPTPKSTPKR